MKNIEQALRKLPDMQLDMLHPLERGEQHWRFETALNALVENVGRFFKMLSRF